MCPTSSSDQTETAWTSARPQISRNTQEVAERQLLEDTLEVSSNFTINSSPHLLRTEDAYRIAAGGSIRAIREAVALFGRRPSIERGLLSAAADLLNGQVARGTRTLQGEWEAASASDRPYVADLLAPLYIMAGRNAEAEELLESVPTSHPMHQCLVAIGIVVASQRRNRRHVRDDIDLISAFAESTADDLLSGKVGQRLALAYYHLHEYERALEFAEKSLDAFARAGSGRLSVTSYSILYNIHHAVTGDHYAALHAAKRMADLAKAAGDRSYHAIGLIAQYEIAAESEDTESLIALRQRIRHNAVPEQYRERFACRIADYLPFAWTGDIERLHAGMTLARESEQISRPMRALATSLMGLSAAALGNRDEARKLALESVGLSSMTVRASEAAYDLRYRLLARANAVAAYMLVGSTVRGLRASKAQRLLTDPNIVRLALGEDQLHLSPSYRGYAHAIRSAQEAVNQSRLSSPLTAAERNVLLLLAEGYSASQIATALGRSVSTVRNQTRSIIDKFDVSGRVAAISQARKLGLIN